MPIELPPVESYVDMNIDELNRQLAVVVKYKAEQTEMRSLLMADASLNLRADLIRALHDRKVAEINAIRSKMFADTLLGTYVPPAAAAPPKKKGK